MEHKSTTVSTVNSPFRETAKNKNTGWRYNKRKHWEGGTKQNSTG